MTISTSDSVANVEVRAKSVGPGFCAVEYSTFGGRVGFDAPPLTYSGWTVLVSHVGKAEFIISERVICDTGVLGEVLGLLERLFGRAGVKTLLCVALPRLVLRPSKRR